MSKILQSAAAACAAAFVVALLYFGTYRAAGCRSISGTREAQIYQHEWQANLFEPAAKVESFVRGKPIHSGYKVE